MENTASQNLYDLLVTRDFEPEILDAQGKAVTNAADADLFSFDFRTPNQNYGTVVVLIGAENDLQVYFGDNLGRGMESEDKQEWYSFLEQLKNFSTKNLLSFQPQNLNRLKYTMQGMAAIKEGLFEGYYGTRKVSYNDQPKQTRLMIKHSRDLGEGDARYRAIESLFVETADGERFKVPSRSLMHGRMLARHIAEGGTPYDAFGQHINQIVQEMATLSRFIRAARGKQFEGQAGALVESAVKHLRALKTKARHMISQRGYQEAKQAYNPAEFSDSEVACEAIRDMFIEQSLDHRIEEAIPVLARLTEEEDEMKEAEEFECWAKKIMEGTWALPDTPESVKKLQDIMAEPLPVGPDATNATEQLYDIFGDDLLFDELSTLAQEDPDADARPIIQQRAQELGIPITLTPDDAETPGADTGLDDQTNGVKENIGGMGLQGAPTGGTYAMQVDEQSYIPVKDNGQQQEGDIVEIPGYLNLDMLPGAKDLHIPNEEYSDTLYYKDPISGGTFSYYVAFGAPRIRSLGNSIDADRMQEIAQSLVSKPFKEDLDTDGVMMTRPTNCSSESVIRKDLNRIMELARIQ